MESAEPTESAGRTARRTAAPQQTLQGVLFDMDGLLVDSEPLWFEVECAVMARLDGPWSEADQQALVGGSLPRTVSYLLDRAGRPASREQVGRWLVDGMTALLMSRTLTMLPGARELLAEVRAAGIPHALVTSSERPIMDAVLLRLGVALHRDGLRGRRDPRQARPRAVPAGGRAARRRPAALRGARGLAQRRRRRPRPRAAG